MAFESEDSSPSTISLSMELNLLWELAIRWKNLVFLSPSLMQRTLDFCLQQVSSKREVFSNSPWILSISSFSSSVRTWLSPIISKSLSYFHNFFPMFFYITKNLHIPFFFKSFFNSFNLFANTKLKAPCKW